jgi:hypothetical protein
MSFWPMSWAAEGPEGSGVGFCVGTAVAVGAGVAVGDGVAGANGVALGPVDGWTSDGIGLGVEVQAATTTAARSASGRLKGLVWPRAG